MNILKLLIYKMELLNRIYNIQQRINGMPLNNRYTLLLKKVDLLKELQQLNKDMGI